MVVLEGEALMANFRLVQREGVDTLHRWPATERCNLDDTDRDTALDIDADRAMELVTGSDPTVYACHHCFPLESD